MLSTMYASGLLISCATPAAVSLRAARLVPAGEKQVADGGHEHLRVVGLPEVRVGIDDRGEVGAHQRNACIRRVVLLGRAELQAVDRGHLEVEQDSSGRLGRMQSRASR